MPRNVDSVDAWSWLVCAFAFVPLVPVVDVASLVRGNGWRARTTFRSLVGYCVAPCRCGTITWMASIIKILNLNIKNVYFTAL
jgi:hypothetical protein